MSYSVKTLSENTSYVVVTPKQIKTLATNRLLKIYKMLHSYTGATDSDVGKHVFNYKTALKAELDTREHVAKKSKQNKNPKRRAVLLNRLVKSQSLYLKDEAEIRNMYNRGQISSNSNYGLREILATAKIIKKSKSKEL